MSDPLEAAIDQGLSGAHGPAPALAVDHDLAPLAGLSHFGEASGNLAHRDEQCARQVPLGEFLGRTHVQEEGAGLRLQARHDLLLGHLSDRVFAFGIAAQGQGQGKSEREERRFPGAGSCGQSGQGWVSVVGRVRPGSV